MHTQRVAWSVVFHEEFAQEFMKLPVAVRDAFYAQAKLLGEFGPLLSRPHVDTLNGSRFSRMKELRFLAARGVWRVAFAFDPARKAIILVAGDKSGVSQTRFYQRLIATADARFAAHLEGTRTKGLN